MLITIGEDIVERSERGDVITLDVLERLANACRYGKHIVYIPIRMLHRICAIPYLNKTVISIFQKLKDKTSGLGSLKDKIGFCAMVTFENPHDPNLLWIHPARHGNMELYVETHLLAENLLDTDFFRYLAMYYQRNHKLTKCQICFYPLQGGGNTIKDIYANEIALAQHLCLAIVDSDKRYPEDQCGKTSEELMKTHDEMQPFNCRYYRMERVREIENLIPLLIIKAHNGRKRVFQFNFQTELSYFDMKKGFVCCDIKNEKMYNYWQDIFEECADLKDNLHNCQGCLSGHGYAVPKEIRKKCDKPTLLDGFGSDLMKNLLQDSTSIRDLKSIKTYHLTESQQEEWFTIGKLVFEWCCAGEKMRV